MEAEPGPLSFGFVPTGVSEYSRRDVHGHTGSDSCQRGRRSRSRTVSGDTTGRGDR